MSDKVQKIKQEIERLKTLVNRNESYGSGFIDSLLMIDGFIDNLPEEPASEDLEEEITKCYKSRNDLMMTRKQFGELIHRFTNWQHGKDFDDILQSEMQFPKEYYEKGRADMREEMMKDAVETTIVNDWQYGKDQDHAVIPAIHQRIKGFTVGDKVKIIICKPEQQ